MHVRRSTLARSTFKTTLTEARSEGDATMKLEMQKPKDVSIASILKVEKDGLEPSSMQEDYLVRENGDPKAPEKKGLIKELLWRKVGNLPQEGGNPQTTEEEETIAGGKRKYSIGTRVHKYFEGHGSFEGRVQQIDGSSYRIVYSDADVEDVDESEMDDIWLSPNKKFKADVGVPAIKVEAPRCDLTAKDSLSLWKLQNLEEKGADWKIAGLPKDLKPSSHRIADFFLFMYERHCIWLRRNLGMAAPWSANKLLQTKSCCNVYRELDRGTAFFRAHILDVYESKDEWTQDEWLTVVLWASYCYRQVNRVESFKDGFPDMNDLSKFFRSMGQIRKDAANGDGVSFFASAHQTTNFRSYEHSLKEVAKDKGALLKSVAKRISETEDMWEMQQAAEELPGVGPFFGWQILCDLEESRCLKFDDSFCELGPGAKDGLQQIIIPRTKSDGRELQLTQAQALVNNQSLVYQALGITFPYWEGKLLTLKEVEHALCEYSKFKRCGGDAEKSTMRAWKSRSEMDVDQPCSRRCEEPSAEGLFCDTCLLFFCNNCVHIPSQTSASWICYRCRHFAADL